VEKNTLLYTKRQNGKAESVSKKIICSILIANALDYYYLYFGQLTKKPKENMLAKWFRKLNHSDLWRQQIEPFKRQTKSGGVLQTNSKSKSILGGGREEAKKKDWKRTETTIRQTLMFLHIGSSWARTAQEHEMKKRRRHWQGDKATRSQ